MEEEIEAKIKKAWQGYFRKRKLKLFLKGFLIFTFSFIFVYLFLTFPAQLVKAKYFFQNFGKKEEKAVFFLPQIAEETLYLPTVKEKLQEAEEANPEIRRIGQYSLSDLQDNHLIIPKINVRVPIIWNSPVDEKSMLKSLQNGVAHYQGTALPDEKSNVFITGHSSYYWWDKGKYKTVFALLPKLEKGDEIALSYKNQVYIYQVFDKVVVKPEETWVLAPTSEPILSLMTCVPIGTSLRRLVLRASPITPVVEQIKKEPKKEPSLQLPDTLYPFR